jgi:transcriptional regulator with XRE-family HTH domain
VRALRLARDFTQETLAERAELSVDAVRRIERGGFAPSLTTLGKLAAGLDLSLATLFAGLEDSPRVEVQEVGDLLARRSPREVRMVARILRAMFADP